MTRWLRGALLLGLSGAACRMSLSPLQNRLAVGEESYVIFAADGEEARGDLFAVRPTGGTIYPVTYTRLHETRPSLSPSGVMLAYLRGRARGDSTDYRVVLMNLLNGAERVVYTATADEAPTRVAWHRGERLLYIATTNGILEATVPPEAITVRPVTDPAAADTALGVVLGSPAFARVSPCPGTTDLCIWPSSGEAQPLGAGIRSPIRWGPDSMAYLVGQRLDVRPLAGGRPRAVRWADPPPEPRWLTVFLHDGDG